MFRLRTWTGSDCSYRFLYMLYLQHPFRGKVIVAVESAELKWHLGRCSIDHSTDSMDRRLIAACSHILIDLRN